MRKPVIGVMGGGNRVLVRMGGGLVCEVRSPDEAVARTRELLSAK